MLVDRSQLKRTTIFTYSGHDSSSDKLGVQKSEVEIVVLSASFKCTAESSAKADHLNYLTAPLSLL